MDHEKQPAAHQREWVVKRHLNTEALKEYVKRLSIGREQVIAITEPSEGVFTLIFEPTDEQRGFLEAEEGQVAETLDTLFGSPITTAVDPAGEEVPVIVAVPTAPETEPSPS